MLQIYIHNITQLGITPIKELPGGNQVCYSRVLVFKDKDGSVQRIPLFSEDKTALMFRELEDAYDLD